MKDFYSFAAFFADVKESAVGRQEQTPMPTAEQEAELKRLAAKMESLKRATDSMVKAKPFGAEKKRIEQARAEEKQLDEKKKALQESIPTTLVTVSIAPRQCVRVLPRGNWQDDSGEVIEPAIPAFLAALKTGGRRATRLDLAHWLVSGDNPMVARVFVNRLWKLFFGQGIVRTLDDFGTQGAPPTHPELLDWLAVNFVESGWDVKRMVKCMVMSRTYRQSSWAGADAYQKDPINQQLARQGRFRLDAEMIRDNALAVSGLMSLRIGGPSVKPYQPAGYWDFLNFPRREYVPDRGENQHRRGIYTYWQRTFPHPSLAAFDAPSREECCVERPRSNTPLQSLVLLDDPTYVEAAKALATRVIREGGATERARLAFAFHQVLGRVPAEPEVAVLTRLYQKHLQEYRKNQSAARDVLQSADATPSQGSPPAEFAAWTSVSRTILNLDETITRE